MRLRARSDASRSVSAVFRRLASFGSCVRRVAIHAVYCDTMGDRPAAISVAETVANASIDNSTPLSGAGSVNGTSALGIQHVHTVSHFAPTATQSQATLCPVANSNSSAYCTSATQSSQSSALPRRGSGRPRNPLSHVNSSAA